MTNPKLSSLIPALLGVAAAILSPQSSVLSPLAICAAADPLATTRPGERLAPPPPVIEPVDQAFLVQTARRTVEARAKDEPEYKPPYTPPALRELNATTFVTLRAHGSLLGIGQAGPLPIVDATATAAAQAFAAAAKAKGLTPESAGACTVEIEIVGEKQRIGSGLDSAEELAARVEPGVEGVGVRVRDRDVYVRPSQILSLEPMCPEEDKVSFRCDRYLETILAVKQSLGGGATATSRKNDPAAMPKLDAADPREMTFFRFRTLHFWQAGASDRPIELLCGMRLVSMAEVTPAGINEVVRRTGRYVVDRQLKDGFFAYEYLPGRNHYNDEEQNWVRQAGAIWAIAQYARVSGDADATRCAERAIDAMSAMVRPRRAGDTARYVATPDGSPKLGTTALFGLALMDAPKPERYAGLATSLAEGVRSLQTEKGQFAASFVQENDLVTAQNYYPGEALLFLAKLYHATRDPRCRQAMDRAMPFYTDFYRTAAQPSFIVWQMQAYGQLARSTTLKKYAEFVYDMADRLLATQLDEKTATTPLLAGSFDAYRIGRTGISTAPYAEGLNEAIRTARAFKDKKRADRYTDSLRRSARFILQLRIKPEETYYMKTPEEAVDAFRTSPADHSARIDHAQHALSALLGVRELCWPAQRRAK